jgi:tryptophan synthase beta subunit
MAAGLGNRGIGPERAHLRDFERVPYLTVTDRQTLDAFV